MSQAPTLDHPELTLMSDNPLVGDVQEASTEARIELYDIDLTPIAAGAGHLYFTPNIGSTSVIKWSGTGSQQDYVPASIYSEGWEVTTASSLPRPKIGVKAISAALEALLLQYNNFERAIVTRYETFANYLDDGDDADPDAYFPPQKFVVDRRSKFNKTLVEWELRAPTDLEGKRIPRRVLLRDVCTYSYRQYKNGAFVYTNVECPYNIESGTQYLLEFTSGGKEGTDLYQMKVGDTVVGDISGAYATIAAITKTTGTFSEGTAEGELILVDQVGTFGDETLSVGSHSNVATIDGNTDSYSVFFTRSGVPCTALLDECGRKLEDCRARFPGNQDLPAFMFPSIARAKVS